MTPEELRPAFEARTELHRRLVSYLRGRVLAAESKFAERHPVWRRVEQMNRLFIDRNALHKDGSLKNPYGNKQIVVPQQFAVRETVLTYCWLTLTSRSPFAPISGRSPEDVAVAQLVTQVIDYQIQRTLGMLTLYSWIGDALDYGIGVIKNRWVEEKRSRPSRDAAGRVTREDLTTYQGNKATIVDVYKWAHDPSMPASRFQDGEFCSWRYSLSWPEFRENAQRNRWLNEAFLQRSGTPVGDDYSISGEGSTDRNRAMGVSDDQFVRMDQFLGPDGPGGRTVEIREVYVKLIPEEWAKYAEMSGAPKAWFEGTYPEIWRFVLAGGVLMEAQPTELTRFPFFVLEVHPDQKSYFAPGLMELLAGTQDLLNWFWNSRVANVDAAVHNGIIFDPLMVEQGDLLAPGPGMRVRTTEEASLLGRDVRTLITQLPWNDATSGHIRDLQVVADFMERLTAASSTVMGIVETGRRSATEISGASRQAVSRLQKMIELMSVMGINRWIEHMVEQTQERMQGEEWIRITGELGSILSGARGEIPAPLKSVAGRVQQGIDGSQFAPITSQDILGHFDFPVMNGTPQPDSASYASVWQQILQNIGTSPVLAQRIDAMAVFKRLLLSLGIKNVNDIEFQASPEQAGIAQLAGRVPGRIAPDDEVAEGLATGALG